MDHKTTFDPLKTITGLVLSPFRLPPAARPLVERKTRKVRAAAEPVPYVPLPPDVDYAAPAVPQKTPWDRKSQLIRAGVPGTPDGGPPPPERGTAMLMAEPGFFIADAKRRARGVRRTPRKRQLVEIGLYLRRYGILRGLACALLLALAAFLPSLMPASAVPAGVTSATPPWFVPHGAPIAEHYWLGSLIAIGGIALGSLILPGILRGLVLMAIGFAPFGLYVAARFGVAGLVAPTPPPGLEAHVTLVLLLFPAWVAMGAGMVAGQNFPDAWPGRILAGLGGAVVLGHQILASGVLRQSVENRAIAVEGLLSLLLFAMTLTAIGQMLKGSIAVSVSFVKAGMLLFLGMPLILALWQSGQSEAERLAPELWFHAFQSLVFLEICYLIAVIGVVEWLHRLAWGAEVRAKLGRGYARVHPAAPEFGRQFMDYAHHSGIYSPEEMAAIHRQLEQRRAR